MNDLKYPIGPFKPRSTYTAREVERWIEDIKSLPEQLVDALSILSDDQLDTPYRPGGWTVRQLVHHIADSHLNSYIRMKWALTEENSTIKPYDQEKWAEMEDYRAPVSISLDLIKALHERWGYLLDRLEPEDLEIRYNHPESGTQTLWGHLDHYSWHGRHHLNHILSLKEREQWK